MSLLDKMKRAGKSVVDAGAKTMLKTDIVFLDREIKTRKQKFGIEIYDLMEELENNDTLSVQEKESKIRSAFDAARKDIAVISAKKECKKEEMSVLEAESASTGTTYMASGAGGSPSPSSSTSSSPMMSSDIPPSTGTIITNSHPADAPSPPVTRERV